jgi:hypothetical protein
VFIHDESSMVPMGNGYANTFAIVLVLLTRLGIAPETSTKA